jgi:hypothetical protein
VLPWLVGTSQFYCEVLLFSKFIFVYYRNASILHEFVERLMPWINIVEISAKHCFYSNIPAVNYIVFLSSRLLERARTTDIIGPRRMIRW